jgi:hypothetical protein
MASVLVLADSLATTRGVSRTHAATQLSLGRLLVALCGIAFASLCPERSLPCPLALGTAMGGAGEPGRAPVLGPRGGALLPGCWLRCWLTGKRPGAGEN